MQMTTASSITSGSAMALAQDCPSLTTSKTLLLSTSRPTLL